MGNADDRLMDMLYEAYIVTGPPLATGEIIATCAACHSCGVVTGEVFDWCARVEPDQLKEVAISHIRVRHRAAAVLTIDAYRRSREPQEAAGVS